MSVILASTKFYQGNNGSAYWEGRVVGNHAAFAEYVRNPVRQRVYDAEQKIEFANEMRALATTGMATEFLEKFLCAVPEPAAWEIGEALAECVLQQCEQREIHWPWNSVRDRRTPRASLPGADLVGFCSQGNTVLLLVGEVKTSSDTNTPPNVMYGGSGMTWQLSENATRLDIQHALLCWLRSRCSDPRNAQLYRKAVGQYLASAGKELLLVGVLLRDTQPDERDVKSRATALADKLPAPTRIEIIAWYLPVPIKQWPALLRGGGP